jgi:protoheme IX farnesyltransferase
MRAGSAAPGPWLRICAAGAAAATLTAVVTGAAGISHEWLSALAVPPLVALAVSAWWLHPALLPPALAALGLFGAAAFVTAPAPHVALAAGALAASLLALAASFRGAPVPNGPWRDYVTLTKPRVMSLLLVTGVGGMFVGAQGWPGWTVLLAGTLGLALACGGAAALNHVLDADIDRLMGERTEARPVAAGRVPAPRAIEYGLALSAASFTLLASTVNVLTAVVALIGNLFYVVVYTRWLKRRTVQNIVIGGAAGAVPPLVGFAAATGDLALPALWLFLIVFLWTPPHFWALALLIKEHYARADVPMLPVVRGERETARQIVLYTVAMVAFTLAVGVALGPLYTAAAAVLGGAFVVLAVQLARELSRRRAAVLFHYSLAYLALLFAAAALDPFVL